MPTKDYHARVSIVLIQTCADRLIVPRIRYWAPTLDAAKIERRKLARRFNLSVRDMTLTRVQVPRTLRTLPDFLNQLEKHHGAQ